MRACLQTAFIPETVATTAQESKKKDRGGQRILNAARKRGGIRTSSIARFSPPILIGPLKASREKTDMWVEANQSPKYNTHIFEAFERPIVRLGGKTVAGTLR